MENSITNQVPANLQKGVKIALIGIAALAIITYRKEILDIAWDVTKIAIVGGIAAYFWIFASFNKMLFLSLCKGIQYAFIKMDPLSFMDRYADMLVQKLKNLRKGLVTIKAELAETNNQIAEDTETVQKNIKLGRAAQQEHDDKQAAFFGTEAKNAQDSITMATPGKQQLEENIKFMTELSENWDFSIKGIRSFNERKRRDYTRLKKTAKVLGQSKEFLNGETPEAQIYQQSIKAANEKMAQWQADVEDFEEKAKPILERGAIEKRANTNEGLDMLKQYSEKLMLPDFATIDARHSGVQYDTTSKEFNLLH